MNEGIIKTEYLPAESLRSPVDNGAEPDANTDAKLPDSVDTSEPLKDSPSAPASPDPAAVEPSPDAAVIHDAPKNADAAAARGRSILLHLPKITAAVISVSVFLLAMYTEISSVAAAYVPESLADGAARLIFGGSYASAESANKPGSNVTHPHNSSLKDKPHLMPETDAGADNSDIADTGNDTESNTGTGDATDRYPIVARDLSTNAERGLTCSNQTDYVLDLDHFADSDYVQPPLSELASSFPPDTENPVVLIIHTHGTESYAEEGADTYSKKDNARTTDITKNVVAVGEVMAEYLESRGIKTLHCTEMFDRDSYIDAYNNSSAAVREYLAIYPSISYIFDVHRDSLISDDYTKYRPVTSVDGVPTAQFMCLVGTNANGADHPGWRDNLTLASHLQVRLWNRSPSLPRRLSVRGSSFYQQYAPGSLLFEIGSCGNTLSEAKACALIVAEEMAEIIIAGE